jgi:DNA-binding PadR family transcriptional regulator
MYRDHSLIPSEAVRLAALGSLALGSKHYADLASEIRQFTVFITGPSLDLVGSPIELLRVEGLIEATEGSGTGEEALMQITPAGRSELVRLMGASLRPPVNDVNKLILTLKLRFLHLLALDERRLQAEAMAELAEQELGRLQDLERCHGHDAGLLPRWLEHEIDQAETRLAWFRTLLREMPQKS